VAALRKRSNRGEKKDAEEANVALASYRLADESPRFTRGVLVGLSDHSRASRTFL